MSILDAIKRMKHSRIGAQLEAMRASWTPGGGAILTADGRLVTHEITKKEKTFLGRSMGRRLSMRMVDSAGDLCLVELDVDTDGKYTRPKKRRLPTNAVVREEAQEKVAEQERREEG